MKSYKRISVGIICLLTLLQSVPLSTFAINVSSSAKQSTKIQIATPETATRQKHQSERSIDVASTFSSKPKSVDYILEQSKFTASQGHGFAAEVGNNFIDNVKGTNAEVIGNNNAKNGADRYILNRDGTSILIQDKYYKDAKSGIDACFETNEAGEKVFRYVDADGNPMIIEVPKDQYDDAVTRMAEKIKEGKIPNVTDPEEAEKLVRKGALTYKQAENLAKAGTIDSLTYDSVTGAISASSAFGISTLINYAVCRINGEDRVNAIKYSAIEGAKTGGVIFGTHILIAQLSKTGLKGTFKPASEAVVKAFGNDFAELILKSVGRNTAEMTTKQIVSEAAKVFRINIATDVVITLAFTVPDAIDLFHGRISKEQFIKNFTVAAATMITTTAGGVAGGAIGSSIAPGAGTAVGAIVGSTVGGLAGGFGAEYIADQVVEDDAEKMYKILSEKFSNTCEDYLVSQEEANDIASALSKELDDEVFKDMYESKDYETFADNLLNPLFEEEIAKREKVESPTVEELRLSLLEQLDNTVFLH